MRNVTIYTNQTTSLLKDLLTDLDDINVRVESSDNVKDYEELNASLLIFESVPNVKDVLLSTKFESPILFVGAIDSSLTIRAAAYDFINVPINKDELKVRVNALLKVKEYKDKVSTVSTTDELTGLHNRKYLHERLDAEISRAKRYKTQVSVLLFDIDFFKVVNDMYGYSWGDILLRNLADKLKAFVRKEDVLTRYGDEEFLLVLPNTSEENAFIFAERFRREIERMEFIPAGEEERHPITISGGIATFPCLSNVEENTNTLIRYAEHALYNAKKRGKNKIIQFSQINLEY